MASILLSATLFCAAFVSYAAATPIERAAGAYVTDISQCPKLAKRAPASIHDLRPDDFSVAMAVGDSITAGAFAKGLQSNALLNFAEWRGVSYAGGGDPGAITVPNLIKYYNSSLQGASVGYNAIPELCFGPLCPIGPVGWNPSVDKLNAAQSGALASNLLHEVRDYLAPMVKASGISTSAYKYLSLQIGSNDLCQLCGSADGGGPGSADEFESHMRATLEHVRLNIPNTLVNLFGVFKVSDIYPLTLGKEYCTKLIPFLPHLNIECSCALLGGSVGEATRALMDSLMTQYNERIVKIVKDYQKAKYSNFAVTYQPANVPLADFPVEALSDVDCFHPHTRTHQRIAAGVWNRLSADAATRAGPLAWEDTIRFRCLEEADRINTSALL